MYTEQLIENSFRPKRTHNHYVLTALMCINLIVSITIMFFTFKFYDEVEGEIDDNGLQRLNTVVSYFCDTVVNCTK